MDDVVLDSLLAGRSSRGTPPPTPGSGLEEEEEEEELDEKDMVTSLFDAQSMGQSPARSIGHRPDVDPWEPEPVLRSSVIWDPPRVASHALERRARQQKRRQKSVVGVIARHRLHGGDSGLQRDKPRRAIRDSPLSAARDAPSGRGGDPARVEYRGPGTLDTEDPRSLQSASQSAYSHMTATTHFSHRPPLLVLPFEIDPMVPTHFRNGGALGRVEGLLYNWS